MPLCPCWHAVRKSRPNSSGQARPPPIALDYDQQKWGWGNPSDQVRQQRHYARSRSPGAQREAVLRRLPKAVRNRVLDKTPQPRFGPAGAARTAGVYSRLSLAIVRIRRHLQRSGRVLLALFATQDQSRLAHPQSKRRRHYRHLHKSSKTAAKGVRRKRDRPRIEKRFRRTPRVGSWASSPKIAPPNCKTQVNYS